MGNEQSYDNKKLEEEETLILDPTILKVEDENTKESWENVTELISSFTNNESKKIKWKNIVIETYNDEKLENLSESSYINNENQEIKSMRIETESYEKKSKEKNLERIKNQWNYYINETKEMEYFPPNEKEETIEEKLIRVYGEKGKNIFENEEYNNEDEDFLNIQNLVSGKIKINDEEIEKLFEKIKKDENKVEEENKKNENKEEYKKNEKKEEKEENKENKENSKIIEEEEEEVEEDKELYNEKVFQFKGKLKEIFRTLKTIYKKNIPIESLTIINQNINDLCVPFLIKFIKKIPTIKRINFSNNQITSRLMNAMTDIIEKRILKEKIIMIEKKIKEIENLELKKNNYLDILNDLSFNLFLLGK
jgi:hypothetical protein